MCIRDRVERGGRPARFFHGSGHRESLSVRRRLGSRSVCRIAWRAIGSRRPATSSASSVKPSSPVRVVLTGGGTGGHVYPALALHEILARAGIVGETLYLGIRGRAEETIVPRRGLALHFVPSAPVAGTGTLGKLRAFLTLSLIHI